MARQQKGIAQTCAKCGACVPVCPVYQSTGRESHTARGKLHLFKKDGSFDSAYFNDLLSKCIQCGACDAACPRNLRPSTEIRAMRSKQPFGRDPHGFLTFLTTKVLASPRLQEGGSQTLRTLFASLPKASGLRKRLDLLVPGFKTRPHLPPPPAQNSAQVLAYFPGCLAEHLYKDIKAATALLAARCGFNLQIPAALTCCGLASHASGNQHEARELATINIEAFSPTDGPILTSCASCTSHLKSYPDLFADGSDMQKKALVFAGRVQEFSTFFVGQARQKTPSPMETVYYHDPCHLRFGPCQVEAEPRRLLTEINGCPPLPLQSQCCGQGGLFHLANPEVSQDIFNAAHRPLAELSDGVVVTTCSGCLLQWQQGLARSASPLTAEHVAVFLAKICED